MNCHRINPIGFQITHISVRESLGIVRPKQRSNQEKILSAMIRTLCNAVSEKAFLICYQSTDALLHLDPDGELPS